MIRALVERGGTVLPTRADEREEIKLAVAQFKAEEAEEETATETVSPALAARLERRQEKNEDAEENFLLTPGERAQIVRDLGRPINLLKVKQFSS